MISGRLRHPITLQNPTVSRGASGGKTEAYTAFASPRAAIKYLSGEENEGAGQKRARATAEIKFRYVANVTTKTRILFGSRTFDILTINNVFEKDRELICQCRENV